MYQKQTWSKQVVHFPPFPSEDQFFCCWMFHFFLINYAGFCDTWTWLVCTGGKSRVWWKCSCATIHSCVCLCVNACLCIHEMYKTLRHKLILGPYDLEQFSSWKLSNSLVSFVYSLQARTYSLQGIIIHDLWFVSQEFLGHFTEIILFDLDTIQGLKVKMELNLLIFNEWNAGEQLSLLRQEVSCHAWRSENPLYRSLIWTYSFPWINGPQAGFPS